jgi:glucose-1-phosphate cytidylyltransferase
MKTVLLAGGLGTRLSEETYLKPKPMVEIGGRPILWHIMKLYSAFGFDEFLVALGYKGEVIKDYFLNFYALNNDLTVDLRSGRSTMYETQTLNWKVHLIETGFHTMTGGRIKRLQKWVGDERFMLTYGDGLADVDIRKIVAFHTSHGRLATVTAVRPPARFGGLNIRNDQVTSFIEKPQTGEGWINGGFFVLEPGIFDYIAEGDQAIWERAPLERLAADGQLMAYCHSGFFQPMDTLREKAQLEDLWASGKAPWKMWS